MNDDIYPAGPGHCALQDALSLQRLEHQTQRAKDDEAFIRQMGERLGPTIFGERCNVGRKIEPGDVVFLKSGGLGMTVVAVNDDEAECVWLDGQGGLQDGVIAAVALTLSENK